MLIKLQLSNGILCGIVGRGGILYWIMDSVKFFFSSKVPSSFLVFAWPLKNIADENDIEDYPLNLINLKVISHECLLDLMKTYQEMPTFNLLQFGLLSVSVTKVSFFWLCTRCSSNTPGAVWFGHWLSAHRRKMYKKEQKLDGLDLLRADRVLLNIGAWKPVPPVAEAIPTWKHPLSTENLSKTSPAARPNSPAVLKPESPPLISGSSPRVSRTRSSCSPSVSPSCAPESSHYSPVSSPYVPTSPAESLPRYSPMSPDYVSSSPAKSPPGVSHYSPVSPDYVPSSPAKSPPGVSHYSPVSPDYVPASPAKSPPGHSPVLPDYVPASLAKSPPGHSPVLPPYKPNSPQYSPPESCHWRPMSSSYRPISPTESPLVCKKTFQPNIVISLNKFPPTEIKVQYKDYHQIFVPKF